MSSRVEVETVPSAPAYRRGPHWMALFGPLIVVIVLVLRRGLWSMLPGVRDDDEKDADDEAPRRVPAGVAGGDGDADPGEGGGETGERPRVLEEDDGQLGALRVADERPPRLPALHVRRLADGRRLSTATAG